MSFDNLPPDQRAVLQLVLQRGRRYDDIAALLSIDRASVRQRALDALDALAPESSVAPMQRALLTDYLLDQLPSRVADQIYERLAISAPDRAWAQGVAAELAALPGATLAEIPTALVLHTQPPPAGADSVQAPEQPPVRRRAGEREEAGKREPGIDTPTVPTGGRPPLAARGPSAAPSDRVTPPKGRVPPTAGRARGPRYLEPPSRSRRSGTILLALGALLVVAGVTIAIVVTSGGSSKPPAGHGTTSTASNRATLLATIDLTSGSAKTQGVADVIRERGTIGIVIVAYGLPANTTSDAYSVWLYNSPTSSYRVGWVDTRVTSNGQLKTDGPLPANAASYKYLLLTLETQTNSKQPGDVILRGDFTES